MMYKIKHPRLATDNNLIIESIKKRLSTLLGLKISIESTSNNSIRVGFNKKLGESSVKNDFLKKEIHKILYNEFGLTPVVSKYKDIYNVILDTDSVYLENHKDNIKGKVDSNIVLDNRFIWLFNILDKDYNILVEEIDTLDDAIELAINISDVKLIIANPYIDPDPSNKSVELVFADNPGPVTIYDGTTTEDFVEEDEKVIEETTQVNMIGNKISYKLSNKELKALDNPLYKDWWIVRDKDSDLMLFKSKPTRSTINLTNSSIEETTRWLPELDNSYDYRDFNKHRDLFEFITWDSEPIQVRSLLEEVQRSYQDILARYDGEEKVFKAIELLTKHSGRSDGIGTLSDEFKDISIEIISLGTTFVNSILEGYKSILSEIQKRGDSNSSLLDLDKVLRISLKKFNYVVSVAIQSKSKKEDKDNSLRSLAKAAGLLPADQQVETKEVADNA